MKNGSPDGQIVETSQPKPAQKPQSGEPNEHPSLYRIRRSQEKYQLLCEEGRRRHRGREQTAGYSRCPPPMGGEAPGAVAGSHGSDSVQRLDLRHLQALCGRAANGASGDDESHRRIQEEERPVGCPKDSRPGALQSVAGMLGGAAGNPRTATDAALSQHGGKTDGADEEQDEWTADGSRRGVQQAAVAQQEIFHRIGGHAPRGARFSESIAAAEPGSAGDVRRNPKANRGAVAKTSVIDRKGEAAAEHTGSGRCDVADMGTGGGRSAAVLFDRKRGELLRIGECAGR